MDPSKLTHLSQHDIEKPCPEDWDAMDGDEKSRFCAGCGCHVHNIAAMGAEEADALLASDEHVCTRITTDTSRGILTRDGWIPRILLAGAVTAVTAAGCTATYAGARISKTSLIKQAATEREIFRDECKPSSKDYDEQECKAVKKREKELLDEAKNLPDDSY